MWTGRDVLGFKLLVVGVHQALNQAVVSFAFIAPVIGERARELLVKARAYGSHQPGLLAEDSAFFFEALDDGLLRAA